MNAWRYIKLYSAVIAGKIIFVLARLVHSGGTSVPGKAALKICPDVLAFTAQQVHSFFITGTNGKTTTVHMIAHMLTAEKTDCFATLSGGNEKSSICTEYIRNFDVLKGKPKRTIGVIECDEKYVPLVLPEINSEVIVITNILQDQTDRLGTEDDVFRLFCDSMQSFDGTICLDENEQYGKKLIEYFTEKKTVRFSGTAGKVKINGDNTGLNIELSIPADYNFNNAAAACAALYAKDKLTERAVSSLKSMTTPFGRMELFRIDDVPVIMNLAKNITGMEGTLHYIESCKENYDVVLGLNARTEDGKDLSWVGCVQWCKYKDKLNKVIVCGDCAEYAQRILRENGMNADVFNSKKELLKQIRKSQQPVFIVMNYTCMMEYRKMLADKGYIEDFWKV